jgi:hypothetical protein
MSSRDNPIEPLPDLDLTRADIEAMRRSARDSRIMSATAYLDFLTRESSHVRSRRTTSAGWEPFSLDDSETPNG